MPIKYKGSIALWLFLISASAQATDKVFSWVDEKGVTHFSFKAPQNIKKALVNIIEIKNSDSYKSSSALNKEALSAGLSPSDELVKFTRESCDIANKNLKVLEAFSTIRQEDKNGNLTTLSEQERKAQLELALKQVEIFCKNNKN